MTSQNLIFSLTCLSLFFLSLQYSFQPSNANCTPSSCGLLRNITFPFRLSNDPNNCGDSKFELSCENDVASIHLNSRKYYVKAIDYRNYTMRVVDVSINSSSICSFPNSSLFDFSSPFESRSSTWAIPFISCQQPLHNSSGFTRVTGCAKGGYTYIKVGELLVQDMDYTCTLEAVALTSWNFTDRNPSNASLSEIHQSLLYGFDLSWIMFECRNCDMGCFVGPGLPVICDGPRYDIYFYWGEFRRIFRLPEGPSAWFLMIFMLVVAFVFAGVSVEDMEGWSTWNEDSC